MTRSRPLRRLRRASVLPALLLALAPPLAAQTEPPCTVSILNKVAKVRADGRWYIPNVPVNMGPVRARMTCTEGGQTRSGTSAFFTIAQDDMRRP